MPKSGKRRSRAGEELPSRRDLVPAHKVRPSAGSAERTTGATRSDLLGVLRDRNIRFLRLQFIDIMGVLKNVEVPASQFEKALDGDIMFDGSSIQGFVRVEESDMMLRPDYST